MRLPSLNIICNLVLYPRIPGGPVIEEELMTPIKLGFVLPLGTETEHMLRFVIVSSRTAELIYSRK